MGAGAGMLWHLRQRALGGNWSNPYLSGPAPRPRFFNGIPGMANEAAGPR